MKEKTLKMEQKRELKSMKKRNGEFMEMVFFPMVKHTFLKKTRLQIDPEIYLKSIRSRAGINDAKREDKRRGER